MALEETVTHPAGKEWDCVEKVALSGLQEAGEGYVELDRKQFWRVENYARQVVMVC